MDAHTLFRLTTSLHGKPHLISQSGFNAINTYLEHRNEFGLMKNNDIAPPYVAGNSEDDEDDSPGVGVIQIKGNLTYELTGIQALCGGCSYVNILEQAEELVEQGVSTIAMIIRSPGGEAYGCFETADELRKLCDENDVELYAYVDGSACSAAYALAVAADEVICNPAAEVGSIGVLVALMNNSEQLKKDGLVRSYITAGDSKVPFADDGSFKEEFLQDLQAKVDTLYESFVDHVAAYTFMTPDAIKATEAKTYLANDALQLGLVNSIMTRSQFVSYITSQEEQSNAEND